MRTRQQPALPTLRERTVFVLHVQEPGMPFAPWSFHDTHSDAYGAGLVAVTGGNEAIEARPGWDFAIVSEWLP